MSVTQFACSDKDAQAPDGVSCYQGQSHFKLAGIAIDARN